MASQQFSSAISPAPHAANLADVLERVLDKGLVVAGDIRVNLLDIELLTIKVRLLLASADKARELGITWWESDPFLSGQESELVAENQDLRRRLEALESRVEALPEPQAASEPSGDRAPDSDHA